MPFLVELERRFQAVQGLPSPFREEQGLPLLRQSEGVAGLLRVGVTFDDDQLSERGWYFDTDPVRTMLADACQTLEQSPWTELFAFRPTFENVARHLFHELSEQVHQLAHVELHDLRFRVMTRYSRPDRV